MAWNNRETSFETAFTEADSPATGFTATPPLSVADTFLTRMVVSGGQTLAAAAIAIALSAAVRYVFLVGQDLGRGAVGGCRRADSLCQTLGRRRP